MIRPKPVLVKWLGILHDKMTHGEITYEYYCNQLRAIRQDLTVGFRMFFDVGSTYSRRVYSSYLRRTRTFRFEECGIFVLRSNA